MALYYTPILTAAAANALTFNNPLQQMDNAIVSVRDHLGALLEEPNLNAAGNGIDDDSDALEAALAAGGVIIGKPGATYRIIRTLNGVSNTYFNLNGATILQDGAFDLLKWTGTVSGYVSFTGNQSAGANTISLPTGHGSSDGWAVGDLIKVRSDGVQFVSAGPVNTYTDEVHEVIGVSSDTLTIDGALIWSHTTANNAKYARITPIENVYLGNGYITNGNDAANSGYTVQFIRGCKNIHIANLVADYIGGGFKYQDVYGGSVRNTKIAHVTDFSGGLVALGYGISIERACAFLNIDNCTFHDLRHAITTIGETDGSDWRGSPRHVKITNCFGDATSHTDSTAIFDTHPASFDFIFENCTATGGSSATAGFQLRSPAKLINCTAYRVGGRGVSCTNGAEGLVIQGGEYAYCGSNGISTRSDYRILGAHIHHNTGAGIVVVGDYIEIKNCRITDNGSYGVQYSSGATNKLTIENNYIPFSSGVQTAGVLSAPATAQIRYNDFSGGYSGNNALQSVTSGAVVSDNIGFVTEAQGATSVADGGTITHGINGTPTVVTVTPSVSGEFVSVTAIGSSTFTVAIKKHDNTAGTTQTVYWRAKRVV